MSIDADTFLTRFPLFDGESAEVIDLIIAENYADLPVDKWSEESSRDRACLFLTAHKLRLEYGDNIHLATGLKEMDENVNLDNHKLIDYSADYYHQTIYGKEFLRLREKVLGISMFLVN